MAILKVENLSKVYGRGATAVQALDSVSFSVERGQFVAIVGASGSGKSTLLHIIGGVDRPTGGRVLIEDTDIYRLSETNLAIPAPAGGASLPVLQSHTHTQCGREYYPAAVAGSKSSGQALSGRDSAYP